MLLENSVLSAHTCAVLFSSACAGSHNDWNNECDIFRASLNSEIPEDWAQSACDDPCWERADLRSMHLDILKPTNGNNYVLFGEGGYVHGAGASFSARVRYLHADSQYFVTPAGRGRPVASRLPSRYGYEESTVHTAELSAMVASLKWRTHGTWNMFVGDRSALFDALREASDPSSIWPSGGSCLPLEGRLRAIMRHMARAWNCKDDMPRLNVDQEQMAHGTLGL